MDFHTSDTIDKRSQMKTADTKNDLSNPYAGFRLRATAFLIDYLVIAVYILLLTGAVFVLLRSFPAVRPVALLSNPFISDLLTFLTLVLPVILYFALFESSSRRATPGKQRMGLQVMDGKGGTLGKGRALFRSFVKFLPWQLAHTCIYHIEGWPSAIRQPTPWIVAGLVLVWVLVGCFVISMGITRTRQTLYDLAAGSYVVVGK